MRVLIVVLGLICAASAVPRHQRIVGGEITTIEKYPFMAGMLTRSEKGGFYQSCGGTLITRSVVVSAGHCFPGVVVATSRVRLGSSLRSSGGTEHLVSRIIVHEHYNASLVTNDIALVRLIVPAVISAQVDSARIAGPNYQLHTNAVVHTIGWGDTAEGGDPSEDLRHVALNVIDHKICAERHAYLKTLPDMDYWPQVTPEMVCTGIFNVGGKDSCQGDSGGPVIQSGDILVAITSWGYECAHPTYPGVNVRVSNYTNWISKNIANIHNSSVY